MTVTSLRAAWLILSAVFYVVIAYAVPRQQFDILIGLLTGLFLGYGWVLSSPACWTVSRPLALKESGRKAAAAINPFLFGSAILFRLLLLVAMPQLSDDFFRFVWDGQLVAHGFNPYLYLPGKVIGTEIASTTGLSETLFRQLNSPNYFTVYPPLNQALFGLAARLSGGSLLWNVIWLRVPILLSEIGTLWLLTKLLRRLNRNPNLALLYGLNPLVILELTGNVHFEGVMIFFTLLAVWLLLTGRMVPSALALALAIGAKLLPLILLPLVVQYLPWRKAVRYISLTGGLTVAQFIPFASLELAHNIFSSINLYFQKFEFNASGYYVLRTIGYWVKGYNAIGIIGAGLSIVTTLSIFWITFRWRNITLPARILAILTIYFAFATTVHPWYITTLVAAVTLSRFRYPLVWSALIPLSYFTYRTVPYQENLWLTALEYGLVTIVASIEIGFYRTQKKAIGRKTNGFSEQA